MVLSNDGTLVASGSDGRAIKVLNVATGINVESFAMSLSTKAMSFADDDMVLVTSMGRFGFKARDVNTLLRSKHEA
jgi:WD40 repeat protein